MQLKDVVLFAENTRQARTSLMSDLPIERLGYRHRPFSNCVVDHFGPLNVTVHHSSEKR